MDFGCVRVKTRDQLPLLEWGKVFLAFNNDHFLFPNSFSERIYIGICLGLVREGKLLMLDKSHTTDIAKI